MLYPGFEPETFGLAATIPDHFTAGRRTDNRICALVINPYNDYSCTGIELSLLSLEQDLRKYANHLDRNLSEKAKNKLTDSLTLLLNENHE